LSLDYLSIALNLDVLFRCASTDSEHYQVRFADLFSKPYLLLLFSTGLEHDHLLRNTY
jgi:hypothetical protein